MIIVNRFLIRQDLHCTPAGVAWSTHVPIQSGCRREGAVFFNDTGRIISSSWTEYYRDFVLTE